MGSVDVYILGQKYTVKGEAPEEHIQKVAAYVDSKIKEVHSSGPNVTPLKASILASLNIADELFTLKAEQEDIAQHIEKSTSALTCLFEK